MTRRALVCVAAALAFLLATYFAVADRLSSYGQVVVTFEDGTTLSAEVARTPEQRSRGLGNRGRLPEDTGMLFVFDQPGSYGFWMKDMRFPIDILWLNDGTVVDMRPDVPVQASSDLPSYYPSAPADQVLETNAGFIKGHEITVGEHLDIRAVDR